MYVLLQCILFQHFMNAHVHGVVSRMVNAMVASSSSIRGSGTLHYVALSTAEVEYVAACSASCEAV